MLSGVAGSFKAVSPLPAAPQVQGLDVEGWRGDSVALPCRGPQLQKGLSFHWLKEGVGPVLASRKVRQPPAPRLPVRGEYHNVP